MTVVDGEILYDSTTPNPHPDCYVIPAEAGIQRWVFRSP